MHIKIKKKQKLVRLKVCLWCPFWSLYGVLCQAWHILCLKMTHCCKRDGSKDDFSSLCHSGVSKARPMGYFGVGKGPIHLSNVRCTGKESSLAECPAKGPDSHVCKHGQDAGVVCDYVAEPEADIAVVGTHTCGLRGGAERRSKRIVGGYKSLR